MESKKQPTALLVGTYQNTAQRGICLEHLDELRLLADTASIDAIHLEPCPLRKIDVATYLGIGKVQELKAMALERKVDIIIFDEELSPSQQRNLEKELGMTVLERREVILDVFARHARTKEAKLQIELASCQYQLPRLKRLWTHL